MSDEWANKLATNRVSSNSRNQARLQFDQNTQAQAQQESWYNNEANKAYEAIQSWEKDIVDNDPDYNTGPVCAYCYVDWFKVNLNADEVTEL